MARTNAKLSEQALKQAGINFENFDKKIDAVACTYGPGLAGSLLVGIMAAKTLSFVYDKPLIAVNHMEGHIFSACIENKNLKLKNEAEKESKVLFSEITPPQKQQATFMFSEFLDVYLQDFEQVEKILKEEKISSQGSFLNKLFFFYIIFFF